MLSRSLAVFLLLTATATAEPLNFLSWNVEGDGADPAIIAKQLQDLDRYDAYCFQEVRPDDAGRLAAAIREKHGKGFKHVLSSFGNNDRLMIAFDESRLTLLDVRELFQVGEYRLNDWNHRPPLVLHLKDKTNGIEFYLMTVHLARANAKFRLEQARGLREWGTDLEQPAMLMGDCNFDFDFHAEPMREGLNESGKAMLGDNSPWRWVVPEKLVDSNWSDRNNDGVDDYPDSLLDFALLSWPSEFDNSADWVPHPTSSVIVREGDFPDSKATSDHRPLTLNVVWVMREDWQY